MYLRQTTPYFDSVRPRSFSALMDMYEQNYIRLRCLCPDLANIRTSVVSCIDGPAHDLHLNVLERTRHTTTLQLTYELEDGCLQPDLTVRIYHDALQAEVLSKACKVGGRIAIARSPDETALLCKWKLNRFLYKWLGYCLRQGHLLGKKQPPLQANRTPATVSAPGPD